MGTGNHNAVGLPCKRKVFIQGGVAVFLVLVVASHLQKPEFSTSLMGHSVFRIITFKDRVPTKSFEGSNRCGSPQACSSFPFILSGQVASFLGFLT